MLLQEFLKDVLRDLLQRFALLISARIPSGPFPKIWHSSVDSLNASKKMPGNWHTFHWTFCLAFDQPLMISENGEDGNTDYLWLSMIRWCPRAWCWKLLQAHFQRFFWRFFISYSWKKKYFKDCSSINSLEFSFRNSSNSSDFEKFLQWLHQELL